MNVLRDRISVIVPVYNEEESISETIRRLSNLRERLVDDVDVELIFVDDGSTDRSLEILRSSCKSAEFIRVIALSRNFGHQMAITAGLDYAGGSHVAVIDADLQDPPELIENMYRLAKAGADVVYGKRRTRAGETWFKKSSALLFYRLLNYLCDINIPKDTGDFRLMTRRATDVLNSLRERHRFVRGLVPWIGFRAVALEYDREERFAGETKYPLRKMLKFAMNAVLSFSSKPLSLAIKFGGLMTTLGLIGGLYMLYLKAFTNLPVPGLTAILLSIVVFSGVQLSLIGLVGEYIARIYEEVKGRPLYIISEKINEHR